MEVFQVVFGLLLLPISYHSFVIKATSKLFSAKTKDPTLFKQMRDKGRNLSASQIQNENEETQMTTRNLKSIRKLPFGDDIRKIKIHFCDMFKLYMSKNIRIECCWTHKRSQRLNKLFIEGEERIEANLDVVKIVRTIRNQKILMKQLLNKQLIE